MRLCAALLLALLAAAPASGQWQRVDPFIAVSDLYAVSLVASDADYVYAAVLTGQPVPNQVAIARSGDGGASWQTVFSGVPGARFSAFTHLDGQMAALLNGGGQAGLLISEDQGSTWTLADGRFPGSQSAGVARTGTTYIAVGQNPSYRSTDSGASWTPFGQDSPMAGAVAFNGTFYGISGIGQVYRLDGDDWTQVSFGASFSTDLWVEGGRLWAKASAGALFSSPDGTTWTEQTAAVPTTWARVVYDVSDGRPWFLHSQAAAIDLLLSDDRGATATSIAAGYPRDANGGICTSNYAVATGAVIGNAWACSFTDLSQNGVFRYVSGNEVAVGPLDPSFGVGGRAVFSLFSDIERGVAVLPLPASGGADEDLLLVGSWGSLVKLRADGTPDPGFGTDGVTQPRVGTASAAFLLADGKVLLAGVGGVWRVNADGTLDTGYGTDGVVDVRGDAAVFADGSVVLQGFYDPSGGSNLSVGLVRLTPGGAVDAGFGTDGYVFPDGRTGGAGVAVDGQGRVVALFNNGASDPTFVYRLTPTGAADASFGTDGVASFPDLYRGQTPVVDGSDRVVFSARPDFGNGPVQIVRLTASGDLDASFGDGGLAELPGAEQAGVTFRAAPNLWTIRVAPDGAYTAGGSISISRPFDGGTTSQQMAYIARVTSDGDLDAGFGDGGQFWTQMSGRHDIVTGLSFDAAGHVLAAGWSDTGFGQQDERAFVLRAFPDVNSNSVATEAAPEAEALALDVWPNPSRGSASVRLHTEVAGPVTVDLYDALGRRVTRLGEDVRPAGDVTFAVPSGLAPGVYVVRAVADGRVVTRSLTVVR